MNLLDAHGRPIDARVHAIAQELRQVADQDGPALFMLEALPLLQIAGALQLALRHPEFPDSHRPAVDAFLADIVREYFAACPTVLALLEAGDNPANDVPWVAPADVGEDLD